MDLTDDESQTLRAMRAVTVNTDGDDVFVGLDPDESLEYLNLTRRNEGGENMNSLPRYMALYQKHEAARQEIVNGEASLDHRDGRR